MTASRRTRLAPFIFPSAPISNVGETWCRVGLVDPSSTVNFSLLLSRSLLIGSKNISTSSSRSSSCGGTCDAWAVAPGRFDKKVYARLRDKSSAKSFHFPGMCAQLHPKSYWASIKKGSARDALNGGFYLFWTSSRPQLTRCCTRTLLYLLLLFCPLFGPNCFCYDDRN